MKINTIPILAAALVLLASSTPLMADGEKEAAEKAQAEELQLKAEYEEAITQAEQERQAAEASLHKAREQLQQAAEQRHKAELSSQEARATQQAEMEKMHEELNRARRQLRETSREIARVNREVALARAERVAPRAATGRSNRPVIGVILGDADDIGIKVLGVSPDGPAEQAGIEPGDVIVALGGQALAAIDEEGNARGGLNIALKEIAAGEPVIVAVERGDQTLDFTVVPEVREPLTWKTVTRFPSAPAAPAEPGEVITIERIVVPEIDTEAITEQIEQLRVEIDERRALMEAERSNHETHEYEFEFHDLSELGDFALHDANIWFGLPLTRGLQLAEIDPGLGEYFKTDRGVLVLKARDGNELQLQSGDVILQVGETEVDSPAEFMRSLRDYESGDEFEIAIKRKRKDRVLKTIMPERRTSFLAPLDGKAITFRIRDHSD
ncbi:MAG: PDZ domain-containing protein [Xanthomonadales bacterium]|nr:PDZ domain-containing protein [Xanthomonadales bacterium]